MRLRTGVNNPPPALSRYRATIAPRPARPDSRPVLTISAYGKFHDHLSRGIVSLLSRQRAALWMEGDPFPIRVLAREGSVESVIRFEEGGRL